MKLKQSFITYDTDDRSMLVPTGEADFAGLVQGNHTLSAILSLLKTETTEAQLVAAMCARFNAPEEQIRNDVLRALETLRSVGALDE